MRAQIRSAYTRSGPGSEEAISGVAPARIRIRSSGIPSWPGLTPSFALRIIARSSAMVTICMSPFHRLGGRALAFWAYMCFHQKGMPVALSSLESGRHVGTAGPFLCLLNGLAVWVATISFTFAGSVWRSPFSSRAQWSAVAWESVRILLLSVPRLLASRISLHFSWLGWRGLVLSAALTSRRALSWAVGYTVSSQCCQASVFDRETSFIVPRSYGLCFFSFFRAAAAAFEWRRWRVVILSCRVLWSRVRALNAPYAFRWRRVSVCLELGWD